MYALAEPARTLVENCRLLQAGSAVLYQKEASLLVPESPGMASRRQREPLPGRSVINPFPAAVGHGSLSQTGMAAVSELSRMWFFGETSQSMGCLLEAADICNRLST